MKILYILPRFDYFMKGRNGSVTHAEGIANGLSDNGAHVDILSGPKSDEFFNKEKFGLLCYKPVPKQIWFILFVVEMFKSIRRSDHDFVVVRFSTKYCLLISLILTIFGNKKWGFEINSLNYPLSKNDHIRKIIKIYEYQSLKSAFFINCVSEKLTSELSLVNNKVFTLPNAGPSNMLDLISHSNPLTKNNNIDIIYLGAIRDYFDVKSVAEVCSNVENVTLHVFGKFGLNSSITSESLNCKDVHYYGEYNIDNVFENEVFTRDYLFILPYKAGSLAEIGSPTKLFEYLSLGRPIISTRVGQPYEILNKAKKDIEEIAFFYSDNDELRDVLKYIVSANLSYCRKDILEYYNHNHTWKVRAGTYLNKLVSMKVAP